MERQPRLKATPLARRPVVQAVTPDKSGRPEKIKATSPKGTLVDLACDYAYVGKDDAKKDGGKIRTSTDAVSGVASGCPGGTTYSVNDAQQTTSKNGSASNWSYDKIGNETAGASSPEGTRTGEKWSDYARMTSVTVAGTTYAGQYGSTDQSERIKLGEVGGHLLDRHARAAVPRDPHNILAELFRMRGPATSFPPAPQGKPVQVSPNRAADPSLTSGLWCG
ncbi:hypothetical protein [Streptomyces sp. RKAG290]|uniref:hypothetical protein n=1 Tax=Streptomyces sp. RKAG290 TaxID=2888348 RepID=UPI0027E25D74|nr:hypothetical protein [Streptomyces sp. RKAG290]